MSNQSAVGDVDDDVDVGRAVVNLVVDDKVIDFELNLLFAHIERVDDFEFCDFAERQVDKFIVFLVRGAVNRTFEFVILQRFLFLFFRSVKEDFKTCHHNVVLAVCLHVCVGFAFFGEHKRNFGCVVRE